MQRLIPLAALFALASCQPAGSPSRGPSEDAGAPRPVTYERLLGAQSDAGNWLMYSGQYHSQRFSSLDSISRRNVGDLQVKWIYQLSTLEYVETTPLVVDGVMYLTQTNDVIALDAESGRPYWTYEHRLPDQLSLCCGRPNRGLAILGDLLYLGTLDARLIALDRKSGSVVWDREVADPKAGYSKTAAPLIVKDMVISGIAGGEFGIRGFLDAFDAVTGERRWRFYTVPGPGESGNDTWEGDSWKTGGAPTWMTGSYDPDLDLIYWGTGNPSPDWNGDEREGDNLYSDSVVALDADTGELAWYFQFTPHDVHDWDCNQVPVLIDAELEGRVRKLMLWANRNGFYYVLDRQTGEFLLAQQFAKQTWAEGIDEHGRPVRRPGTFPTPEGTLVYPSANGAANWWSPTYSPATGLLYLTAYDGAETYYLAEDAYAPGQMYLGSTPEREEPYDKYFSAVRALDALTGKLKWEFPVTPKSSSGLLSTAGGLVFGGSSDGYFFALDDETGEVLWRINVGGTIHAAPITYLSGPEQRITIAAGSALFTFGL